jgi:hypothetical protein
MINIPNKNLSVQENDFLVILCGAIFLETKDTRLFSVMCLDTVNDNIERLMESSLCEQLYDMINIFGERDFIHFVTPVIKSMAAENHKDVKDYVTLFEETFNALL